jgi:hypothetical protein
MRLEFIGPPSLMVDGGVSYPAVLDGKRLDCQFSYEALEDVDPDSVLGDPMEHFARHQLKLLSIAEQKITKGHSHDGILLIHSGDLVAD